MEQIIFATDGSESAQAAGKAAFKLLQGFPEARLTVVYVEQPSYYDDMSGVATGAFMDEVFAEAEKDIEEHVLHDFAPFSDRVRFLPLYGHPAKTICDVAMDQHADLIIVGSHGRGAWDRLFLGSVSQAVVNRAKVPVLVVK